MEPTKPDLPDNMQKVLPATVPAHPAEVIKLMLQHHRLIRLERKRIARWRELQGPAGFIEKDERLLAWRIKQFNRLRRLLVDTLN